MEVTHDLRKAVELAEALKSGKFRQGTGALRKGDTRCCLGVACEISKVSKWHQIGASDDNEFFYIDEKNIMPLAVSEYFGFHTCDASRKDRKPIIIEGLLVASLWLANDNGATFEQIAYYILENYEQL